MAKENLTKMNMYAKYVKDMNLPKIEEGGASPKAHPPKNLPNRFTRNHEKNKSVALKS